MAEERDDDRDRCVCGALVGAHWSGARGLERGSCRTCGLQLVRLEGEAWRHVRG